jgi:uncharacterized protein (DUF1778 family)
MSTMFNNERIVDKRDDRIGIRIPRKLRIAIERAAERDRRKLSDWIALALEDAVRRANGSKEAR